MKGKNLALALLALAMVLGAGIGTAMGYFTAYTEARGAVPLRLGGAGGGTSMQEDVSAWTKRITVTNDAGAVPVYIRARAFCGSAYTLTYDWDAGWYDGGDGYYYFSEILSGGASTAQLRVKIGNIPEQAEQGDSFDVVVVYESTPVLYGEGGEAYADWDGAVGASGGIDE